ncbi:MAG: RuBisCO large subunit C-terminal-like domain-containing protein, partial [Proteobacteria bacterium]|nr:RuBisCO large subunit C-terminal-like domain-containing protein [Pseudomonadota bacterium]
GHQDGGVAGAKSLKQARDAWLAGVNLLDYAKEHPELKGAFESFSDDADKLFPGWRQALNK